MGDRWASDSTVSPTLLNIEWRIRMRIAGHHDPGEWHPSPLSSFRVTGQCGSTRTSSKTPEFPRRELDMERQRHLGVSKAYRFVE